ncbi:MAG: dcd [Solirubrobacterales bacterium]|nr:dcd [Solirubrobacterales bacterium]
MSQLHYEALVAATDDPDLRRRLVVMPLMDKAQIGPASIDIRLGTEFKLLRRIDDAGLDPGSHHQPDVERMQEHVSIPIGESLWLHPGQFVLGSTLEFIRFPVHLSGYVVGRSSWGRLGLLIATAIMVQPGFAGNLTLELVNHGEGPIALYPGCRIGQLAVHTLPGDTAHPYTGKYLGPIGPEISRFTKERQEIARLKDVADRLKAQI